MFDRTQHNLRETCGIMYGKMERSLKLLRRIYFIEIIVLLIVGGAIGVFMSIYAAPNKSFVYQGRITGADFLPLDDGTYYMRIKLHTHLTNDACAWSTGTDTTGANCAVANATASIPVVVTRSVFSLPIGDTAYHASMPNVSSLDFKNTTYFLEVSFATTQGGSYETLTPRTKLGASASAVTILDALQANTFNQVPGSYTQINDADGITASETSVTVDSTAGYPSAGTLLIDTEAMTYTATTSVAFTGLTRGVLGTTAATHADNATVKTYLMSGAAGTAAATLSIDHTNAVTTITVGSTAGYPSSGAIRIDSELITYTGTTATTFTGATRAARGTSAAAHSSGATVKLDISPTYFITSDGNTFINSNATGINPQVGFQVSGTTNYSLGIDRSDSSKFKVGLIDISTTPLLTLDSRTTTSGVSAALVSGLTAAITAAPSASYTTLTVTPPQVTFSAGSSTITAQNAVVINQPTIIGGTGNTVTDSATLMIAGAPLRSTSGTFTNTYGLKINSASSGSTNSYGLAVAAQTGGTNNYSAIFTGGNVGIGTTAPITQLHVRGSVPTGAINATGTTTGAGAVAIAIQGRHAYVANATANTLRIFDISDLDVQTGTGTVTSSGTTVTGSGTAVFTTQLAVGDTIIASSQARVVASIASATSLATDSAFSPSISSAASFTFLKSPKSISNPSSFAFTGAGTVTTSNASATVTGVGTSFTTQLSVGDTITIGAEAKTISAIASNTSLTANSTYTVNNASVSFTYTASFSNPRSVVVKGQYAYVVNMDGNRMFSIDISSPAFPAGAGSIISSSPRNVVVQGQYAYVVSQGNTRLEVINISNPFLPVLVGSLALTQVPVGLAIQGRYVYLTKSSTENPPTTNTLQIVDISNPASPSSVGTVATSIVANAVAIQGRYAYVTNDAQGSGTQKFEVFDVRNPASPVSAGSATLGTGATPMPMGVAVQGRYAYVTNYAGQTVQIFDISDPTAPTSLGTTSGLGGGVVYPAVQGRYLFVPNFDLGTLQVLDIGGSYIQELEVGGLEIASGQVRNDFTINNLLDVRGGVNVGLGGLFSAGPLTATGLNAASTASALDIRNVVGTNLLYVENDSKVGLGVIAPSYDLSLSGSANRTIGMEAVSAGNGTSLTLRASNGTGTSVTGGTLVLSSGQSTGTATAKVQVQVSQTSAVSDTTGNAPATIFEFVNGHMAASAYSGNGTVSSSGTTVTGTSTSFTRQFAVNNSIISGSQSRTVTTIASNTSLTIDSAFSPELSGASFTIGPQVSSCGTSASISGSDTSGKVTIPTDNTSACTITFARSYASAPACFATYQGDVSSLVIRSAPTTSQLALTLSTGTNSDDAVNDIISYFCIGLGTQ